MSFAKEVCIVFEDKDPASTYSMRIGVGCSDVNNGNYDYSTKGAITLVLKTKLDKGFSIASTIPNKDGYLIYTLIKN